MDPLLRSFGFMLKDVNRLHVQRFEQRADAFGLTLPQCRVLIYLAGHEGISQVQLAELTDLEPMTLVRILDRMESDGWLERRSDPEDRRARRLYLKAKGKPLVEEIWQLIDLTRQEAFAGIPRRHTELLIATLASIRNNFLSLQPLSPPAAVPDPRGRGHARAAPARRRRSVAAP